MTNRWNNEERKMSAKNITIESRKVEVNQVTSDSNEKEPVKIEASTVSESSKNKKMVSTENTSSFNTSSKTGSVVNSPPPEKETNKNVNNQ